MTYELVLDNSKMLANCLEEAPPEPIIIDMPGWDVNGPGGIPSWSTATSSYDTATEIVLTPNNRIAPEYFAETDHGVVASNINIFMPTTPDGYELTRATYVVIAYRAADDGAADPSYTAPAWQPPGPSGVPFLYCESSGVTNGTPYSFYIFDPLPVGSYAGEIEWPDNELLGRITGAPGTQVPANRLWNEDFRPGLGVGTTDIHIAYFGMRLYYDPV